MMDCVPENFDFGAAVHRALLDTFAPAGRLEELKRKPMLTGKEVEELYGIPSSSLKTWRSRGGGPRFSQPQKNCTVLYAHEDVEEFLRKGKIKG